tara:strand:- start:739 stop:987 length:249 start_codon:yes stop_codon:yes gene_type:complete
MGFGETNGRLYLIRHSQNGCVICIVGKISSFQPNTPTPPTPDNIDKTSLNKVEASSLDAIASLAAWLYHRFFEFIAYGHEAA